MNVYLNKLYSGPIRYAQQSMRFDLKDDTLCYTLTTEPKLYNCGATYVLTISDNSDRSGPLETNVYFLGKEDDLKPVCLTEYYRNGGERLLYINNTALPVNSIINMGSIIGGFNKESENCFSAPIIDTLITPEYIDAIIEQVDDMSRMCNRFDMTDNHIPSNIILRFRVTSGRMVRHLDNDILTPGPISLAYIRTLTNCSYAHSHDIPNMAAALGYWQMEANEPLVHHNARVLEAYIKTLG